MVGNYWAIAIGINQYQDQRLQSLMYAQRDAQALFEFWQQEAQFIPDQCRLLADVSPATTPGAIAPIGRNIEDSVAQFCEKHLQTEDFLWCFFSGYGMQVNGSDYLLPMDANLDDIPATGIAVKTLFEKFAAAPTRNIVLVLDMNRSLGAMSPEPVGHQVIDLANQAGIATFLSCKPEQTSHETLTLRQGLFTAAMLEGLRYEGCVTVEQLAQYVSTCVPTLCEHHWRPRQDPLTIVPSGLRYQLILPGKAIAEPVVGAGVAPMAGATTAPDPSALDPSAPPPSPSGRPPSRATVGNGGENHPTSTVSPASPSSSTATGDRPDAEDSISDSQFWRQLLLWGGLLAGFLLLGVIYSNWAELSGRRSPTSGSSPDVTEPAPESTAPDLDASTPDLTLPPVDDGAGDTSSPDPSTAQLPPPPTGSENGESGDTASPTPSPLPATGADDANGEAAGASAGTDPSTPTTPTTPLSQSQVEAAVQATQTALNNQEFSTALQQLNQIPTEQRPANYEELLRRAAEGVLLDARATVSRPRAASTTNQASDLNAAIQVARRIQPGQPYYEEAQDDIRNWSRMILDLARGRASQRNQGSAEVAARNYGSAIAAAQLIPPEQQDAYTTAQQSITQWGTSILNLAQAQASRGNLVGAIRIAQRLPGNTPATATAQQSIAQWSQQLLDRARSQANEGSLEAAIQTARSIPANTPAYNTAQDAIATWEDELNWY
jgi:hypothetical protein